MPERGIILRAQSGHYAVLPDDSIVVACRARRHLRRPDPSWPEFPVPGDEVDWRLLSGAGAHREGVIESVHPRRTEISRTRFGAKHVVLANLEQLVVVASVRDPALDRGLVDRLLVVAERNKVAACLCLNKVDLAPREEYEPVVRVYERAGYSVLATSTVTGEGIEALRQRLRGVVSACMGPSGAGKSHLISSLQPGLHVQTGMVNPTTGQGRHTTTRVDLHRTDFGALLADTPGVRGLSLWRLQPEALRDLFPEFRAAQETCRFAGCTHDHEPACAVKDAVETGDIEAGRYRSYAAILEELRQDATLAGATRAEPEPRESWRRSKNKITRREKFR